jgi:hypothetical protein
MRSNWWKNWWRDWWNNGKSRWWFSQTKSGCKAGLKEKGCSLIYEDIQGRMLSIPRIHARCEMLRHQRLNCSLLTIRKFSNKKFSKILRGKSWLSTRWLIFFVLYPDTKCHDAARYCTTYTARCKTFPRSVRRWIGRANPDERPFGVAGGCAGCEDWFWVCKVRATWSCRENQGPPHYFCTPGCRKSFDGFNNLQYNSSGDIDMRSHI